MPDVGSGIAGGAAVIGGIGSLFGGGGDDQAQAYSQAGAAQAAAAKYAADMQYKAAKESNQLIEKMYQTGRSDLAPWRLTGSMALDVYSGLLGLPSIYNTQMPTLPGQNALAAGLPQGGTAGTAGTGGTAGTPGTPGTTQGQSVNYGDYGYNLTPGGTLTSQGLTQTPWGNMAFGGAPKPSQQPQFVGMYDAQTPIYSFGGKLFYPSTPYQGGDLYDTFNRSLTNDKQMSDKWAGADAGREKPQYSYNPWNYLKYGPAGDITQSWQPFEGGTQGVKWIPGYTPPVPGTSGTAGTAGTTGATTNALAPYDISSPSNRIDPTAWVTQTPGYQFQLGEGLKTLDRSAAARGMLLSGPQQKAAQEYGQNYALGHYDNLMNRLASLAGIGQTSSTATGSMGMNAANMSGQNTMMAAQNAGMARMAGAGALGSGYINAANVNAANQNAMWNNIGRMGGALGGAIGNIFGGGGGGYSGFGGGGWGWGEGGDAGWGFGLY